MAWSTSVRCPEGPEPVAKVVSYPPSAAISPHLFRMVAVGGIRLTWPNPGLGPEAMSDAPFHGLGFGHAVSGQDTPRAHWVPSEAG